MIPRNQRFLANSATLSGTVTRFAIIACTLDPVRKVAVLKVRLDWMLRERIAEPAKATRAKPPWQASLHKRDSSGPIATVEVSAPDVVVNVPGLPEREYRFHAEMELELPSSGGLPRLDATIRPVESRLHSPTEDLIGYAEAPDLDPDGGAFAPEVTRWLHQGMRPLSRGANPAAPVGAPASAPPGASARPPAPALVADSPIALPAAHREAAPGSSDGPDAGAQVAAQSEPVDAAVFCPPAVGRASSFLLQVFLYPPAQAEAAGRDASQADAGAQRRGVLSLPLDLPRGTRIDLRLEMPGLRVDEADAAITWRGATTAAQFDVAVPGDAALGTAIGRLRLSIAGVPAGTLRFQVSVAAVAVSEPARATEVGVQRYRRAFVSYSSKDRGEVLRRVQAFRIAGLSVFQDILDLEPGDRWERELYREIDNCDLLLLFWSSAAAASPWVAKEIDYALVRKQGRDDLPPDIQPVPIEGPPIPTPPEKLRHLHFNDALLAHIAAAQTTQ